MTDNGHTHFPCEWRRKIGGAESETDKKAPHPDEKKKLDT